MHGRVPDIRIRPLNQGRIRPDGAWILYWMTAHRRTAWNFALERAVEWAAHLGRPLLVYEPLRLEYPWASERLHAFMLDGMRDNQTACTGRPGVGYLPWVEPAPRAGDGLLAALAQRASVMVTDDFPAFVLPRVAAAAAADLDVRLEAVDGNGLLPIRQTSQVFTSAHAFRRFLQRTLADRFPERPLADPLEGLPRVPAPELPGDLRTRWASAFDDLVAGRRTLADLPIDHAVGRAPAPGGASAARGALDAFLACGLPRYADDRNKVQEDATSGLSPYLHFGHLSTWEVFDRLMRREGWLGELPARAAGARDGWWGVTNGAEQFLDQIVTWRELGYNMCANRPDAYDQYDSLPEWARRTLDRHRGDPREYRYDQGTFAEGRTHDPLWNAAQGQLHREGRIHNYVRMLWGKKILEWSAAPEDALAIMSRRPHPLSWTD